MRVVVGNALEFHSGEIGSIPIARSIFCIGAVAHLVERFPCTDEVASSILVSSTKNI